MACDLGINHIDFLYCCGSCDQLNGLGAAPWDSTPEEEQHWDTLASDIHSLLQSARALA